jgi:MoxR-like ATPase
VSRPVAGPVGLQSDAGTGGAQPGSEPMTPDRFRELALAIEAEIGRLIVGQAEIIRFTLMAMIGRGHVLLEGVPGVGKTLLVRSMAAALDLDFARVQFTPDLMPGDITGSHIVTEDDAGRRRFEFQPGPIFTNLLLADEVNRATPKTQSALLEAMQERQVTAGDETRPLQAPFFVLATQNPIEHEGTYPLPEAQLDRFFFKLSVPLPEPDELVTIAQRTTGPSDVALAAVAKRDDLSSMAQLAREVPVATHVLEYAARLITATSPGRPDAPGEVRRFVRWGSSPRGMQALVIAGRIRALLDGRYNVAFDDLTAVAPAALRHRIGLSFEADAAGVEADDVIRAVIAHVGSG